MHEPDEIIGPEENPYMLRWWLFRPPTWLKSWLPIIYLHNIRRSDNCRALHDHVSWNISLLIDGYYEELIPLYADRFGPPFAVRDRKPFRLIFRHATDRHSIQIPPMLKASGIWSIWIRGPWQREWGFHDPERGWIPHYDYDQQA